jgi:tungstate transport system permease protein
MPERAEILGIVALTLRVSISAILIACTLGIPAGTLLGLNRFRGKRLVELLTFTGMSLPPVVVGLLVFLLLSNRGPLGFLEWLFTPRGMVLAQVILALPIAAGLTAAAVEEVSPHLRQQIRAMGATVFQERTAIIWEARRGIVAASLAAMGRIIAEVGAVMLVGGNIAGRTRVLSTAIVLETQQGEFQLALWLGAALMIIALVVNLTVLSMGSKWIR